MKEILARLPTKVSLGYASSEPGEPIDEAPPKKVVVVLQFSEKGFGFGEVTIQQTPEGVFLDTECMSLDRVKGYFNALLDAAITDRDDDPERHALYNRVTGRSCNSACPACVAHEAK